MDKSLKSVCVSARFIGVYIVVDGDLDISVPQAFRNRPNIPSSLKSQLSQIQSQESSVRSTVTYNKSAYKFH
jgi:hypothetical protein